MTISSNPYDPMNKTLAMMARSHDIMAARLHNGALSRDDVREEALRKMGDAIINYREAYHLLFGESD